jgi:hypothetical protein
MKNKSSQSAPTPQRTNFLTTATATTPSFGVCTVKKLAAAILLCFCLTAQAWGVDFSIDGLSYTTTGTNTVSVSGGGGDIVIPGTVVYGGVTYNVTSIPENGFKDQEVTSIIMPEGLTGVGDYGLTFSNQSVSFISIPHSMAVASRYDNVDRRFHTLEIRSNDPSYYPTGGRAFLEKAHFQCLVVPKGRVEAYKAHSYWSYFGNKIVESSLFPNSLYFDAVQGQGLTVEVTSSTNWTVATNQFGWIHTNITSGNGNGAFTVTVDPNTTSGTRKGTITVMNANGIVKQTVSITQYHQSAPVFSVFPGNLDFACDETQPVTVEVTAPDGTGWTVSTNQCDWLTTNTTSGSGNETFTIMTTSLNNQYEDVVRKGAITVTNENGMTKQIVITQHNLMDGGSFSPMNISFPAIKDDVYKTSQSDFSGNWTAQLLQFADYDNSWCEILGANADGYLYYIGAAGLRVRPRSNNVDTLPKTRYAQVRLMYGNPLETLNILVSQFAEATTLEVSPATIHFLPADGGTSKPVNVTSNVHCAVSIPSEAQLWLTADTLLVGPNETFHLTAAPNTGAEREATVAVSGGGITRHITVTQAANPMLNVSTTTLSFGHNETTTTRQIDVTSCIPWTAQKDSTWIVLSPTNPSGNSSGNFTIAVNTVNTGMARTGKVIISNGTESDTIYVTQQADPTFDVTTTQLTFDHNDITTTRTINVTSHTPWTAVKDSFWIVLNPTSGNGSGNFTVAMLTANPYTARTGSVIVSNGTASDTIYVTQRANPTLEVSADTVSFDAIPPSSPQTVTVTSFVAWTAEVVSAADAEWLHLGPTNESGSVFGGPGGRNYFEVTADDNHSSSPREADIKISAGENDTCIHVRQENSFITLSPHTSINFGDSIATQTISVTSNTTWTVESDAEWLTPNPTGGSGDGEFTISALRNMDYAQRFGQITVSNTTGDVSQEISVTQAARPVIGLSPGSFHLTAVAPDGSGFQQRTVHITSDVPWKVSSPANGVWLNIDTESGDGNLDLTVSVSNNPTGAREAWVYVLNELYDDKEDSILISQSAYPPVILSLDSIPFAPDPTGDAPITVGVTSYTAWKVWKVEPVSDWLSLATPYPSGSGNGDFSVSATSVNTGTAPRHANIIVSNDDGVDLFTDTVHVSQDIYPWIDMTKDLPNDTLIFEPYSSNINVSISGNISWKIRSADINNDAVNWLTLTPGNGSAGSAVFKVETTPHTNTEADRRAMVIVSNAADTEDFDTIYVWQRRAPKIILSQETLSFDYKALSSQEVNVEANVGWAVKAIAEDAEATAGWISLNPTTSTNGNTTFTVRPGANTGAERRARVIAYNTEGAVTITDTLWLTQGPAPRLSLSLASGNKSIAFAYRDASSATITVTSNVNWTITTIPANAANWLMFGAASGSNDGGFTVTAVNNAAAARQADIIVSNADATATDTIRVSQAANPLITVSAATHAFRANQLLNATITVTSYLPWQATTNANGGWLTIAPSGGNGTGAEPVTLTAALNEEYAPRAAWVFFYNGTAKDSIRVTQSSFPLIIPTPGTVRLKAEAEPGVSLSEVVTVESNDEWNMDNIHYEGSAIGWLTISNRNNTSFTVTAQTNESNTARQAKIPIRNSNEVDSVVVWQDKYPWIILPTDTIDFDYAADAPNGLLPQTITVNSNVACKILSTTPDWLTVAPASSNGSSADFTFETELTLQALPNTTYEPRKALIVISNENETAKDTLLVRQQATSRVELSLNSLMFASQEEQGSLVQNINIDANTSWTVTVPDTVTWLTVSPTSGVGKGCLKMTASPNTNTEEPREATITIEGRDKQLTLQVAQAPAPMLESSTPGLYFEATDSLNVGFDLTSSGYWTATVVYGSTDSAWLTLSPSEGEGSRRVIATVKPNQGNTERQATINITSGHLQIAIGVLQAPLPNINLSSDKLYFASVPQSGQDIEVLSYVEWEITTQPVDAADWLHFERTDNGIGKKDTITVTADPNSTGTRKATVVVRNPVVPSENAVVEVMQVSSHTDITLDPARVSLAAVPFAPTNINVDASGSWTVSSNDDWISYTSTAGFGPGNFGVLATNADSARLGTVTVTNANGDSSSVIVLQAAPIHMKLLPDTIYFANDTSTQIVDVVANCGWALSSSQPWLTFSVPYGYDNGTFNANVARNTGGERSAVITANSLPEGTSVTIRAIQAAAPQLVLATDSLFFEADETLTQNVNIITANGQWHIQSNVDWLMPNTLYGSGEGSFTMTASLNETEDARNGKVVVFRGNISDTIHVSQAPTPLISSPVDTLEFDANNTKTSLTKTVNITANGGWGVSSDAEWLSFNETNGSGDGEFDVTAQTNTTSAQRTGTIIITRGSKSIFIHASQAAAPHISWSAENIYFASDEALTLPVGVNSNIDWEVSTEDVWLSLDKTDGNGNGSVNVTALLNPEEARQGKVIVENVVEHISDTLYVSQAANAQITVAEDSLLLEADEDLTQTVNVAAYVSWNAQSNDGWISFGKSAGNGNDFFEAVVEINHGVERRGKIIVSSGIDGGKGNDTILVVQKAIPQILLSEETLSFDGNETAAKPVTVTANVAWEVDTDSTWLFFNHTDGAGNGDFTVGTTLNNTGVERRAVVVVSDGRRANDSIIVVQTAIAQISVTDEPLLFGENEQVERNISVTSNGHWQITTNDAWLIFDKTEGNGPGSFNVGVATNTEETRRDTIYVTTTIGNTSASAIIPVTQDAASKVSAKPTALHFARNESLVKIVEVTANGPWRVEADVDWLTFNPSTGDGDEDFAVIAHDHAEARQGVITITRGTASANIQASQDAAAVIQLSETSISMPEIESSREVNVESNVSWDVSANATWLSITPSSGSGIGKFTITTEHNIGLVGREAVITVAGSGKSAVIHVEQMPTPAHVSVSEPSISFGSHSELIKTVNVSSNIEWEIISNASWLKFSPTIGKGDKTVTITALPNNEAQQRNDEIIISGGIPSATIMSTQNGAPAHVNVSPKNVTLKAYRPESRTISVTANAAWTVSSNAAWLTCTPQQGYKNETFTITTTSNTGAARHGVITIHNGDSTATVQVSQDAYLDPQLKLSPSENLNFEANVLLTKTVQVSSNGDWTVTKKNDSWLTLSTASGSGNGGFNVVLTPNTGAARQSEITVTCRDRSITLNVSQAAYVSAPLNVYPANLVFESNSDLTQTIAITSTSAWMVSENIPWLTISALSGNGDQYLYATATANTSEERQGTITVTGSGTSIDIQVTQKPALDLRFAADGIYYYTPDRNGSEVEVAYHATDDGYQGNITIPATASYNNKTYQVTKIGEKAFYKSSALLSVALPSTVVDIGDRAFAYCNRLASVDIPGSVERIGEWAFCACSNLTSVALPNSVKRIMNGAFYACTSLTSVAIPEEVTNLACMSFYACDNLTTIDVYWTTPPTLHNVNVDFSDYKNCTLYVPAGTKRSYTYNWNWASFVNIIERSSTEVDKLDDAVFVHAKAGRLYVDVSPTETIYVYSLTGRLLKAVAKDAGSIAFDVPSTEKIWVVRGSSGWAKKVIVND